MFRSAEGHELAMENDTSEQAQHRETESHEKGIAVIVMNVIEEESRYGGEHYPQDVGDNPAGRGELRKLRFWQQPLSDR